MAWHHLRGPWLCVEEGRGGAGGGEVTQAGLELVLYSLTQKSSAFICFT